MDCRDPPSIVLTFLEAAFMHVADRHGSSPISTTLVSLDGMAGRFHPGRPIDHHIEPLTRWRVVTRHPHVAREVARLLDHNGDDTLAAGNGVWEVVTTSTRVRIAVCRIDRTGIVFRLADAVRLGEFCITSAAWELAYPGREMKRLHAAAGGRMLAVLVFARVIFTTRCDRKVLYARPELQVLGPQVPAPADQRF